MEHKLITGGEQYLPFARSRIKALRATGLKYASQQFEIDGCSVKVRIEPGQEHIALSGKRGRIWILLTAEKLIASLRTDKYPGGTVAENTYTQSGSGVRKSILLRLSSFSAGAAHVYHSGEGAASASSSGAASPDAPWGRPFTGVSSYDASGYLETVREFAPYNGEAVLFMTDHPYTSGFYASTGYGKGASTISYEEGPPENPTVVVSNQGWELNTRIVYKRQAWSHSMQVSSRTVSTVSGDGVLSDTASITGDYVISPPIVTGPNNVFGYSTATLSREARPFSITVDEFSGHYGFSATWGTRRIAPSDDPGSDPSVLVNVQETPRTALITPNWYSEGWSWAAGPTNLMVHPPAQYERVPPAPPYTMREVGWHKQGYNFIHYGPVIFDRRNSYAGYRYLGNYRRAVLLASDSKGARFVRWKNRYGSMAELELCVQPEVAPSPPDNETAQVIKSLNLLDIPAVKNDPLFLELLSMPYRLDYLDGAYFAYAPGDGRAIFDGSKNMMGCTPHFMDSITAKNPYALHIQILPDQADLFDKNITWG